MNPIHRVYPVFSPVMCDRLLNIDKGLNKAKCLTTPISYSHAIIENIKACSF